MHIKTPMSGMSKRMNLKNLQFLKETDQIKFVLMDESDYVWAKDIIFSNHLIEKFGSNILMSPAYGMLSPKSLATWILRDNLPLRVQLQIHKYIWASGEDEGV